MDGVRCGAGFLLPISFQTARDGFSFFSPKIKIKKKIRKRKKKKQAEVDKTKIIQF